MSRTDRRVQQRDAVRRYGRRGVARAVIEAETVHPDPAFYYDTHPIAEEMRRSYSSATIDRLAHERTPNATGVQVFGMAVNPAHPCAARWP